MLIKTGDAQIIDVVKMSEEEEMDEKKSGEVLKTALDRARDKRNINEGSSEEESN
jgi:hypothetical protein